tara:strand:- start:6582 stop:7682 length:1101 start_codon:yes stop_codon:yes gene_type:complete
MSFLIKESDENDKNLVELFNKELKENKINFSLPLPEKKQLEKSNLINTSNFILIEDKSAVRAGYSLKVQLFKINDNLVKIGFYYNPVAAGLFNKKYNICGLLLINDAQKKFQKLFCLGMGSLSKPLPKLLSGLSWKLNKVPFFFKVCNSSNFLKNIKYLKNIKSISYIIILLNTVGFGSLLIKFIFLINSLINIRFKKKNKIDVKEIKSFDPDLDYVWENTKQNNTFIAVRNHEYLKQLYSDEKFIKLKFFDKNQIIGWSISLCTQLKNHKQFHNMKLGSIIDCLSLKGYEDSIINQTTEILKNKGSDLIVSNQSHTFWRKAFKRNSFLRGPSNFIFASSQDLTNNLNSKNYMHINRGDGDGPINL